MEAPYRRKHSEDLSAQIGQLREISIEIGNELSYQQKLMREVDEGMFGTGITIEKLSKGVGSLIKHVQKDPSMWIIMLLIIAVMMYLYSRF